MKTSAELHGECLAALAEMDALAGCNDWRGAIDARDRAAMAAIMRDATGIVEAASADPRLRGVDAQPHTVEFTNGTRIQINRPNTPYPMDQTGTGWRWILRDDLGGIDFQGPDKETP